MSNYGFQSLIPFPSYTEWTCAQRFPGEIEVQKRMLLLRAALLDHEPRAHLAKRANLSQGRLSQLINAWQQDGVAAFFRRRPVAPTTPPSIASLRDVLRRTKTSSFIELGTLPSVQVWAVHIHDPLERGRWVRQHVLHAVTQADAEISTHFQLDHVLARAFFNQERHASLMHDYALSRSRLYALMHDGLARVRELISVALTTEQVLPWHKFLHLENVVGREKDVQAVTRVLATKRCVDLVGVPGFGKTTLAAQVAQRWWRAGWNVCWIGSASTSFVGERLSKQLFEFAMSHGFIAPSHVDYSRPFTEQIRMLASVFDTFPCLIVLNNLEVSHEGSRSLQQMLAMFANRSSSHALFVGQHSVRTHPGIYYVEGLPRSITHTVYKTYKRYSRIQE